MGLPNLQTVVTRDYSTATVGYPLSVGYGNTGLISLEESVGMEGSMANMHRTTLLRRVNLHNEGWLVDWLPWKYVHLSEEKKKKEVLKLAQAAEQDALVALLTQWCWRCPPNH